VQDENAAAGLEVVSIDACDALVWIADRRAPRRASTAIRLADGCLLVDPVDAPGLDDVLRPLGPVTGVCMLLDRHRRDCRKLAERHGCPLLVPSTLAGSGEPLVIPGIQERAILAVPGWNESCLWLPARRLLVCAEVVGTAPWYLAGDEPLGVQPLLRIRPPRGALGGLDPLAIAVGHGAPVLVDASQALERAIATARRNLPAAWLQLARAAIARR
jgi:hypothetical protein